jgi:hypothetical protein
MQPGSGLKYSKFGIEYFFELYILLKCHGIGLRDEAMRHEFDIFERFSDGSSVWRATVSGRYEAQRRMQELSEQSDNAFFILDIHDAQHPPYKFARPRFAPTALEKSGARIPA